MANNTKDEIKTDINNVLAENTDGDITATKLKTLITDIVNASRFEADALEMVQDIVVANTGKGFSATIQRFFVIDNLPSDGSILDLNTIFGASYGLMNFKATVVVFDSSNASSVGLYELSFCALRSVENYHFDIEPIVTTKKISDVVSMIRWLDKGEGIWDLFLTHTTGYLKAHLNLTYDLHEVGEL